MIQLDVMALVVFSGSSLTKVFVQWNTPLSLETEHMTLLVLSKISKIKLSFIAQAILTMQRR